MILKITFWGAKIHKAFEKNTLKLKKWRTKKWRTKNGGGKHGEQRIEKWCKVD